MNRLNTALAISSLAILAAAPFFGIENIPLDSVLSPSEQPGSDTALQIFWQLRVPRVLTAYIAGGGLALAGLVCQTMFRNPLATPYTLGTASGASFGAAAYIASGITISLPGIDGISVASFAGASLAAFAAFALASAKREQDSASVLLAGVAVGFFFSSLIMFLQYMTDFAGTYRIFRWLMGGLDQVGPPDFFQILPFVATGTLAAILYSTELNLLLTGDDIAASRGVDIARLKKLLFAIVTAVVAAIVSVAGPIGFVGLMAPHVVRRITGHSITTLLPGSILAGGLFLVICDTVARTIIAPAEIPVGVITALIGGPFFLWLLVRPGGYR